MYRLLVLSLLLILLISFTSYSQERSCSQLKSFDQKEFHFGTVDTDAQTKMEAYDVKWYYLDVEVSNLNTFIKGSLTMRAEAVQVLDTVLLELSDSMVVDSVLEGQSLRPFSHENGVISIDLSSAVSVNQIAEVEVFYHGTATSSGSGLSSGMSNGSSPSWGNQVTWTLSQPYGASNWFPVKQNLNDQIDSIWMFVTTDTANKVGSNGVLEAVVPVGANQHRYEWKSRYPINYYLISLAVAEYVEYNFYAYPAGTTDSIHIVNYIYNNPQTLVNFKFQIDLTKDMMEVFSELYGMYPFADEKYGHSMAPFSGGMEHQTMTTQGFFNFGLTAHELGHQWFGNHVTCNSWKHIFVNEGLATYSEFVVAERLDPLIAADELFNMHDRALRSPTGSVYVDDTRDVGRIFSSSLSYNKGASLMHMIRYEINNDSIFFAGMREYQSRFSFGTADAEDLRQVFEDVSGLDFETFFQEWYYGEGFPTFDLNLNWENGTLYLDMDQVVSAPGATPSFETHFDLDLELSSGPDTLLRLFGSSFPMQFVLPFSQEVVDVEVDPNDWLLDDQANVSRDISLGEQMSFESAKLKLGPNPAKNYAFLQMTDGKKYNYKLMDLKSSLIEEGTFEAKLMLERGTLKSGLYLLEVSNEESFYQQKLVFN